MVKLSESVVEEAALEWLGGLGYQVLYGPDIAPGEPAAERESYGDVVLLGRLRDARARLNPALLSEALDDALLISGEVRVKDAERLTEEAV